MVFLVMKMDGYDFYIAIAQNKKPWKLEIGLGGGYQTIYNFPSKADPTTLNFSVLSVHYNTIENNDSKVFCNGKYIENFTKGRTLGDSTFTIGAIRKSPRNTGGKEIAHFAIYQARFNDNDIKRIHYYLCKRYLIDHDAIDFS